MKERRDNNAAQFKEMVDPAQLEGLSEAESMNKIAQMLQERMLVQETELREGKRKIMVPEADDVMIVPENHPDVEDGSSALLALPDNQDLNLSIRARSSSPRRVQEDKMKVLKERRMRRKEERAKSSERDQETME